MLTIKVSGDAKGGWLCEIHDGATFKSSSPEGKDEWEAMGKAVELWWHKPETPAEQSPPSGATR